MAQFTVAYSNWKDLTNEVMTSLYLYGTSKAPQDLNDRVKDPSRAVTVTLNAANIMSSGPGIYANPSQVPFVKTLFNPLLLASWMDKFGIADGEAMSITQLKARIVSRGGTLGDYFSHVLQQFKLNTSSVDYALRMNIYNTQKYALSDDTRIVFDRKSPSMQNVGFVPQNEQFNFQGGGVLVQTGNKFKNLAEIDPQGIGNTVSIKYDATTGTIPIRNQIYTRATFSADGVSYSAIESGTVIGLAAAYSATDTIIAGLKAGKIIEYERDGKQIVYGSVGDDVTVAGSSGCPRTCLETLRILSLAAPESTSCRAMPATIS